jgi:hypothetical protein
MTDTIPKPPKPQPDTDPKPPKPGPEDTTDTEPKPPKPPTAQDADEETAPAADANSAGASAEVTVKQPAGWRRLQGGTWTMREASPVNAQGGAEIRFDVRNTGNHAGELTISTGDQTQRDTIRSWQSRSFNFSLPEPESATWVFTPSVDGPEAVFAWELLRRRAPR